MGVGMSSTPKALVTGASAGIGRAIAQRLLAGGYRVVGLARRFPRPLESSRFEALAVDLSDLDALPGELDRLVASHDDVDVLILNAGRGEFGSLEELSYSQIRSLVALNFTSHAFVVRAFLPLLKRRGRGHLVFLGSEAALAGRRRGSVYCATKFALRGFAQALRDEGSRRGLRVTVVNPGMVDTDFFKDLDFAPGDSADNYILPHDVAEAVWLALSTRPGTVVDEINLSPLKRVVRKRPRPSHGEGRQRRSSNPEGHRS